MIFIVNFFYINHTNRLTSSLHNHMCLMKFSIANYYFLYEGNRSEFFLYFFSSLSYREVEIIEL